MTDGQNAPVNTPETQLNRAAEAMKTREHVDADQVNRWQKTVTTELRPVRPIAHPAILFWGLLGLWAVIVLLSPFLLASFGWHKMDAAQNREVWLTIIFSASLTTALLTREMIPGSRAVLHPVVATPLLLIGLLVVFTAGFTANGEADLAGQGLRCLRTGLPLAAVTGSLFCLFLRRGAVPLTRGNAATIGFFSGLCSLAVLELHCPNLNRWHILLTHYSIPLSFAALGAIRPTQILFLLRKRSS